MPVEESQKAYNTESESLRASLNTVYVNVIRNAESAQVKFPLKGKVRESECSRDNLLSYIALREHDLSNLQLNLAERGLSSLGRLESEVIVSVEKVIENLGLPRYETDSLCRPTFTEARLSLAKRSQLLLGRPREGRKTRIMVTLDSSNIHQPELLEELLKSGMDIARINCAHDSKKEWKMLIDAIRHADERLIQRGKGVGRRCRIMMDLAGPKIRTGPMEIEVRPLKISVPKDSQGKAIRFVEGFLDSEADQTECVSNLIGVPPSFVISIPKKQSAGLTTLKLGEKISFKDSRDRFRTMIVLEIISPTRIRVGLERTVYLKEGLELHGDLSGSSFTVGPIKPQPIELQVKAGDVLRLYKNNGILGHKVTVDKPAGIGCTLPEVLQRVQPGHRVFIDDGKIGAIVLSSSNEDYIELEITSPVDGTSKIRPEKGLNLPDSALNIPSVTSEDINNLDFVAKHATAVALSFVHRPEDLYDLRDALDKIGHPDIGIVAKIETADAIHNLAHILVAGLELPKFGILIARGDLAVEVGFENLALVQEDILCLCEAAHIPVILATQVLETLAKSGLPTRAEITDAAMGQRAECVMLNKGTHILEAVKTLSGLLSAEERHYIKKRHVFREFTKQRNVFEDKK
ncbi:MAG TPA: pyruvate kinase [Candidatus Bathyarchaeia archaeon]|nr:pyruvate kinase [Candidatus Bathyarchaeia archaeon]